jgi:hypothetical protein
MQGKNKHDDQPEQNFSCICWAPLLRQPNKKEQNLRLFSYMQCIHSALLDTQAVKDNLWALFAFTELSSGD